jgi:hypothetical protein
VKIVLFSVISSRHLESRGVSSRTLNTMVYLARLLFTTNGFAKESIKLERYYVASDSRVREEYVPSFEEALRVADCSGSLRNRCIVLFMQEQHRLLCLCNRAGG